jgi:branched-chain amino acid transport system ATP-binding protein
MAVLFTEHSMDVVFGYADRILVLARGRLIAQGDAQEVRSHPEVRRVYFGSGTTFSGVASPEADILPSSDDRSAIGRSDTAPDETLLRIQGLNAWYGDAHILRDVSLLAGRGEVVALMGRNGAGKSTTMKAAMGLLRRRTGLIDFMGTDISASQPCDVARLGLGYVPEDRRIFTDLTVTENLLAGRQPQREGAPGWSLDEVFELFPHLAGLRRRRAGEMSGGEQQMLAVARTLMGNPHLLLLDEPSEGVAPVIVEQMAQMILALKGRGASVLLSEQNLHFACLVSDRAYVLEKGVIRYEGSMAALAGDDMLRSKYLEL